MQCVARRTSDGNMLRLIRQWLKVPVQTNDKNGKSRMTGGYVAVNAEHLRAVLSVH